MKKAISNTSPLLYLHRIGCLDWLPSMFSEIWVPGAVIQELKDGIQRGYDSPDPFKYPWMKLVDPNLTPSEWLSLDLGKGEISAMSLALENPGCIILLDDALARRTAKAAGLCVWGTLKVLLEAKNRGLTEKIAPLLKRLEEKDMWISDDIVHRILLLAGEISEK